MIWVLRGRTIGSSDGAPFEAGPGGLIVLPEGLPQRYAAEAERPWEWLWVHLAGPMADAAVAAMRSSRGTVAQLGLSSTVRQCFDTMVEVGPRTSTHKLGPAERLCADTALASLLAMMLRELDRPTDAAEAAWDSAAVTRYIDEHLADPLRAQDLAAVAGWSLPHFNRLFARRFGTSPMRYLADRRTARASSLLRETALPMTQVARAVGYDDPLYFSRAFKKNTGVSPTAYRRTTH